MLASSSVASSQVLAALAWAFAITGFALYLASFGTFEDTYGTIGSGIVLLVWITMFSMLYYVTPDLRVSGIATLGAGAALSAVTWLVVNAVLAVCVAGFDSIGQGVAGFGTAAVLVGGAVDLQRRGAAGRAPERARDLARGRRRRCRSSPGPPRARMRSRTQEDLVEVVARALQNDVAYDGMLKPIAAGEEEAARLSDLELDIGDWGFTYGVAWAVARAQDPQEPDESVAARALDAALQVFRLYCGAGGLGGARPPGDQAARAADRALRGATEPDPAATASGWLRQHR